MANGIELKDGWFAESEVMWPGQKMALQVEEVLFHERSELQDILVFQSATYGKVLVLDGVIQLTERDEHAYQEMITHIPIFAHPNPKRVLILGGGDGGVLREVCKHASIEEIVMCEIDPKVVQVSKKFLPGLSCCFDDERVTLLHQDGAKYLVDTKAPFDIVIVDSSDPVGPAETLFEASFYKKARDALDPQNGVLCVQGECIWLHLELIKNVMNDCGSLFPSVNYAFTTIPTYPSGQIGFVVSSRNPDRQISEPLRVPDSCLESKLRYYSPQVHRASFTLPSFAETVIGAQRKEKIPFYKKTSPSALFALTAASMFLAGALVGRKLL